MTLNAQPNLRRYRATGAATKPLNAPLAIRRIQNSFNEAFEHIAVVLPRLAEELNKVLDELQRGGVSSASTDYARELIVARDRTEAELLAVTEWVSKSHLELRSILDELTPCMTALTAALGKVRSSARQLRVLALNASFVAQRGDNSLRGFAAATTELIQIAAEQLRGADTVLSVVSEVSAQFDKLTHLGAALTCELEELSTQAARSALSRILENVTALYDELDTVRKRCSLTHSEIARVMSTIQRQDILRQGLEHIELVCRELEFARSQLAQFEEGNLPLGEALEAAELQRRTGDLCASLLEEIHADAKGLLLDVTSILTDLRELSSQSSQHYQTDATKRLRHELMLLREGMSALENHVSTSHQLQSSKSQCLSAISCAINQLPPHLRAFVERQQQVRTLEILVRRQHAHDDALIGAAAIAESLGDLQRDTATVWQSVLDDIAQIRAPISRLVGVSTEADAVDPAHLEGCLSALEGASRSVTATTAQVGSQTQQVLLNLRDVTQRLLGRTLEVQQSLDIHQPLMDEFRALSALAADFQDRYAPAGQSEVKLPTRLTELLEHFTIFSHKRLAYSAEAAFGSNGEPQGDPSENLTLF